MGDDGADDEDDDDVGDVEENDVGVKATVSISIWRIRGGEEDIKKRSRFVDISHIAQRTQV